MWSASFPVDIFDRGQHFILPQWKVMHILTPEKNEEIEQCASMSKIYSPMIRVPITQCLSYKVHCKQSLRLTVEIEYRKHKGKCPLIPTRVWTLLYTEGWVYIDRLGLPDLQRLIQSMTP